MEVFNTTQLNTRFGNKFTIKLIDIFYHVPYKKNVWKVLINTELLNITIPTDPQFREQDVTKGDSFEVTMTPPHYNALKFRRFINELPKVSLNIPDISIITIPQSKVDLETGSYTFDSVIIDNGGKQCRVVLTDNVSTRIIAITKNTITQTINSSLFNVAISLDITVSKSNTGNTLITLVSAKPLASDNNLVSTIEATIANQRLADMLESSVTTTSNTNIITQNTATTEIATVTDITDTPNGEIYWYTTNFNDTLQAATITEFNKRFPDKYSPWWDTLPALVYTDSSVTNIIKYNKSNLEVTTDYGVTHTVSECTPLTNDEIKAFLVKD